jgi:hypothetical protein
MEILPHCGVHETVLEAQAAGRDSVHFGTLTWYIPSASVDTNVDHGFRYFEVDTYDD